MNTQTGKINVQTENIFPIIKKFLYSDHEIFLRELVSNAVDATQKLKALSALGEAKGEIGDTTIEVSVDKDAKTITIADKGIGMTAEEIEKYITQIAFSGATEFIDKYKDKTPEAGAIIGHFGLGFYSAFMVAKRVEIFSLSYKENAEAVHWSCEGSPEYIIEKGDKSERGTTIVLHIAEDSEEFLEQSRIENLLKKYCKFLPVSIKFGTRKEYNTVDEKEVETEVDNIINNTSPAWTRKPSELKEEDYKAFYHELYPMNFEEPLFHIHLNVDYPFNLTGILFFPKLKKTLEVQKDKIQLYCNQVFVTDSVENIVPDFLTLLRGVIDSPDIPLNVSRSYLQADANVKKISGHITKKVADKLEELYKNDRKDYESKWDDLKIFIQYGMLAEEKFYERASKFNLFKNTKGEYYTFEELSNKLKPLQTNKDNKLIVLYTNNASEQHAFVEKALEKGYEVMVMDSPLEAHFIDLLERKNSDVSFARIDSNTIDKLINKEDALPSRLSEKEQNDLKPVIEGVLPDKKFAVVFESLSQDDQPMQITNPEFMRRMKEMQALGGGMSGFYGSMPEMYNLVVNSNHALINKAVKESDENKKKEILKQASDLALLSQNLLKGEDLTKFIKRSFEIITQ
ncbi:MAG: molecular chaperone HtpG [Bacteroidia bacterium]|nr:molecular chaperone HtpG [Bacteroidia bacterium]MCZ2247928.1 molecular chaperone HtpG [Bacteroidia bacterium]